MGLRDKQKGKDKKDEKEWVLETLPYHASHEKGSPASVNPGDKADMTGHYSRGATHPHGKEEVTLDRRTT